MLKFDFNNMTSYAIGTKQGVDIPVVINNYERLITSAYVNIVGNKGKGWQEWCNLPYMPLNELDEIVEYTSTIREQANDFVVFGIGGSALGPLSVTTALLHQKYNYLSRDRRQAPRLFVEDNIDPLRMSGLLDVIDINKAYFNVITKSGETSETLAQFLILYDILIAKLGKQEAKKRIVVVTTIGKGALYNTAVKEGFKIYGIGKGVGGRFSVFSPVGLITFGVMGIDIKGLMQGAKSMSDIASNREVMKNPALLSALLQVESMRKGKNISVLMPYSDQLKVVADFYCQLWAESLGKLKDNNNKIVNVGQTPVKSLGATDQHSQMQLYTEGPFDKVITIIGVDNFVTDILIPNVDIEAGEFLSGHTMGQLLNAERIATEFALTKSKRPNFTISMESINASNLGELLTYFMYQTAYAGAIMNINAFDQPGVEEGKLATFAMIGREEYHNKLQEMQQIHKDEKYII